MSVSSTDSTEIHISGIARDSIVDGEGIRLTVFTQGCPRRCPGCHNPDTQPLVGGRMTTVGEIIAEEMEQVGKENSVKLGLLTVVNFQLGA